MEENEYAEGGIVSKDIISRVVMGNPNQECTLCRRYGLEKGDTLYQVAYPDTGIDFYAIHDIKYCPLCGKELKEDNT